MTSAYDRILGCLLGGAAGDALGYAVEFSRYEQILRKYGESGIRFYEYDRYSGQALISDDTQMTLFTAEGLLTSEGNELGSIYRAYRNWLETQSVSYDMRNDHPESALMQNPGLFRSRAPGMTCLSSLSSGVMGTVGQPLNDSKGCGGIMRTAPIAFLTGWDLEELDWLAAQASAITHGHPLGYLPSALTVHMIHKAIYENAEEQSLRQIVETSLDQFGRLFTGAPYLEDLTALVTKAMALAENGESDISNIRALGEGWVAEETLAIAVYCALRYGDDFSKALAAAVNHDGDSDSTGAVTGNLLGAYLGESKIDPKWKRNLELYELLPQFAARFTEMA